MGDLEQRLAGRIEKGLSEVQSAKARHASAERRRPQVAAMREEHPLVSRALREAKAAAIENLEQLLNTAVDHLTEKGCQVFRARTAEQALNYINALITDGSLVVKSKSNAAKEIHLTEALSQRGVQVVETDLGDRICQVGGIQPAHPLGPAIHVPVEKVAEIFSQQLGLDLPPRPEVIVAAVRESLRHNFFEAEVGISGANAIAADTGSILVMENEGNIRALTSLPRIHIVISGIEKIVPSLEDGLKVVKAAALYGTAQDVSSYVSIISGPSRLDLDEERPASGGYGPTEVHVVLLEMGRFEAIAQGFKESLYCINCGNCLRVCPVYGELGEQYGYGYFGGIGIIHAAMRYGFEEAREGGLSFCVGCKRCVEACPSDIPVPDMIKTLRSFVVKAQGQPWRKNVILKRLLTNRLGFKILSPLQKLAFRPVPGRKGTQARFRLFSGSERVLPQLVSRHLFDLFSEVIPAQGNQRAKVGYFPGCLGAVAYTGVGTATIEVLTRNGIEVWLPAKQVCCGLPLLSAGDQEGARDLAKTNIEVFARDLDNLDAIIVDCPTCYSGLKGYALEFQEERLWEQKARMFANKVQDISQFLWNLGLQIPRTEFQADITYHHPCHLKQENIMEPLQVLKAVPGIIVRSDPALDACCGFGGMVSYDHYRLTQAIARRRVNNLVASQAETVVTACPGCMLQLEDGLQQKGAEQRVLHIVEILAAAYAKEGE